MATQSSVASSTHVRTSQIRRVVRVAAGNALEMYDFQIYGYYAAAIAFTFFPGSNEYASLMLSLATFGAGFLMRPLGALVLGAYIDHHGRRKGLLLLERRQTLVARLRSKDEQRRAIATACWFRTVHSEPPGR